MPASVEKRKRGMEDEMAESAAQMKEQQAQEEAERKALTAKVLEQFWHSRMLCSMAF